MTEPLQSEYLAQCERDARRFQGAYIGTSGTLAAHLIRVLKDRKRIAAENDSLRAERERLVVRLAMLEERQAVTMSSQPNHI